MATWSRYLLGAAAVLVALGARASAAMAGPVEDCNTQRAGAARAPCTLVVDDKKHTPTVRAIALLMRARAALDLSDLEQAEADVKAAFAMRPGTPFGHRVRGRLRGLQGRNTEARADLSKAIQLSESSTSKYVSYLDRGNFLLRILELPAATADFETAIRIDPTKGVAYVGRALANKSGSNIAEALADLDRAKAVEPSYWLADVERGDILVAEKRYADAVVAYDHALAMRGNDARALRGRAAANALISANGKPTSADILAAPTTPTAPKTPLPAAPKPGGTTTTAPAAPSPTAPPPTTPSSSPAVTPPLVPPPVTAPPASVPKVAAPSPAGPAPASPPLPAAPSTAAPISPPPVVTPATTKPSPASPQPSPPLTPTQAPPGPSVQPAMSPEPSPLSPPPAPSGDDADSAAKQAEERRAKFKEALELRQKGKHLEAIVIYDALLRRTAADADAAVEKGRTLMALAKWKEALEAFKLVIESKTAPAAMRAIAFESQSEVLAINNQFAPAVASATSALLISPKLDRALFWRGYSWHSLGAFEKALVDFQLAAATAPKTAQYPAWEAIVLTSAGNLPKARDAIDRAFAIQPDNPIALAARASLNLAAGDLGAAEADIAQLARRGALSPMVLQTQQLIMIHKVLKPSDRPLSTPRQ